MTDDAEDVLSTAESVLDMKAVDAEILAGVRAFNDLLTHRGDDFTRWSITIRGLRALRNLAFARSHTSDIKAWAYRQELGALLQQRKYSALGHIDKQTRSSCYRLMDHIEEIATWYATLDPADQMRWKHPESIVKHAPKHLLASTLRGHNRPPTRAQKKPVTSVEIERLKALLIQVIRRLLKYEPEAAELLDQVAPRGDDPNDNLDDI